MPITVSFLRYMAVERQCCICRRRYLAATEGENPGICGACLLAAFPSPMEEELLPVHQEVRPIQR
jgi:hypothetical protein